MQEGLEDFHPKGKEYSIVKALMINSPGLSSVATVYNV
jgi:hypothetical protein